MLVFSSPMGDNLLVMICSDSSWNILHNLSMFNYAELSGRLIKGPDVNADVRFWAAVTICSSGVILGALNLLLLD